VALGRHPLLRQLLRERKLVAPFKNKVASSRAYYVVVSPAAKAKKQVREFADWLVAATHVETLEASAGGDGVT
jgi:LysR family glycine cleavage system transcriptional activator